MSKARYRESGAYSTAHGRLKAIVLGFEECINAGDPEALMAHQTGDFRFIDMSHTLDGVQDNSWGPNEAVVRDEPRGIEKRGTPFWDKRDH